MSECVCVCLPCKCQLHGGGTHDVLRIQKNNDKHNNKNNKKNNTNNNHNNNNNNNNGKTRRSGRKLKNRSRIQHHWEGRGGSTSFQRSTLVYIQLPRTYNTSFVLIFFRARETSSIAPPTYNFLSVLRANTYLLAQASFPRVCFILFVFTAVNGTFLWFKQTLPSLPSFPHKHMVPRY